MEGAGASRRRIWPRLAGKTRFILPPSGHPISSMLGHVLKSLGFSGPVGFLAFQAKESAGTGGWGAEAQAPTATVWSTFGEQPPWLLCPWSSQTSRAGPLPSRPLPAVRVLGTPPLGTPASVFPPVLRGWVRLVLSQAGGREADSRGVSVPGTQWAPLVMAQKFEMAEPPTPLPAPPAPAGGCWCGSSTTDTPTFPRAKDSPKQK